MREESRRGVTLMEMMMVVVVIGILATMAVVNFGPARREALNREAIGYLQMLRQASLAYFEKNGVYPTDIVSNLPGVVVPPPATPTSSSRWTYSFVGSPPTPTAISEDDRRQVQVNLDTGAVTVTAGGS